MATNRSLKQCDAIIIILWQLLLNQPHEVSTILRMYSNRVIPISVYTMHAIFSSLLILFSLTYFIYRIVTDLTCLRVTLISLDRGKINWDLLLAWLIDSLIVGKLIGWLIDLLLSLMALVTDWLIDGKLFGWSPDLLFHVIISWSFDLLIYLFLSPGQTKQDMSTKGEWRPS